MRSQHNWGVGLGARSLSGRVAVVGSIALMWLLVCAVSGARGAETIYWGNYNANSIGFAEISGSAGGELNTGGATVRRPEGMAIDSSGGRIYWTNRDEEEIITSGVRGAGAVGRAGPGDEGTIGYANLDGSGSGGALDTGGAPIDNPIGVAIDPVSRTIYWSNASADSIGYAKLASGEAGELNTSGAVVEGPGAVAVDVAGGRLYWANGVSQSIAYAELDGSGGGGELDVSGATPPEAITGLAVDESSGRAYWVDVQNEIVSYAALDGSGGGDVDTGAASFELPYGAALDPVVERMYWANYGKGGEREGALAYASTGAPGGGDVTVEAAPVAGPQWPVILKPPIGEGEPEIGGGEAVGARLTCTRGSWGADFAGSFVYRAPRSYSYQWSLDGEEIPGATTGSYTASSPGSYGCSVTASNYAGSATQSSGVVRIAAGAASLAASTTPAAGGAVSVSVVVVVQCCGYRKGDRPARVRLALDVRRAEAAPGGAGVFMATVRNAGSKMEKGFRICARLGGAARRDLVQAQCVWVPRLAVGQSRRVMVRVPVGKAAAGTYRLRLGVVGRGPGRWLGAKVVVR